MIRLFRLSGKLRKISVTVFLFSWLTIQASFFAYTFVKIQQSRGLRPFRSVLGVWLALSKASASVCNLNSALVLLSMCRVSIDLLHSLPLIGDFPWDSLNDFHKLSAFSLLLFAAIHVLSHYVNMVRLDNSDLHIFTGRLLFGSGVGITGHLMIAILIVIGLTSIVKGVRKRYFEVFWILHQIGIALYVFCLCIHGAFCFVKSNSDNDGVKCSEATSWRWVVAPLTILAVEKFYRFIRAFRHTELLRVIAHPSMVLELHIHKPSMKFKPGQYVYVNFPAVSKLQWHPFTITSIPGDGYAGIHLRVCGYWTRQVALRCGVDFLKDGTIECVQVDSLASVLIDGPFGDVCRRVPSYEIIVLIGAGIGQTPFAAVLKHLRMQYSHFKKVFFIGVCRETYSYEWFHELVHFIEKDNVNEMFIFRFYVTGSLSTKQIANICLFEADYEAGALSSTDPVTLLSSPTFYGRPVWQKIFDDIATECSCKRVGVFFCGPSILGDAIADVCALKSNNMLKFEFFREKFS